MYIKLFHDKNDSMMRLLALVSWSLIQIIIIIAIRVPAVHKYIAERSLAIH